MSTGDDLGSTPRVRPPPPDRGSDPSDGWNVAPPRQDGAPPLRPAAPSNQQATPLTRPSPFALLPALLCLVMGFVVGQLLAKAPVEATQEEILDSGLTAPATTVDGQDTSDLAPVTATASGTAPVDRRAADAVTVDQIEAVAGLSEEGLGMAGELDRLLASGRIQALLVEDESALQRFLFKQYLELGDHEAAWELLENSDASTSQWSRLASALNEAGDGAGAIEAWRRGVRLRVDRSPMTEGLDWQERRAIEECLNGMRGVDPQAAMALLEELDGVSTMLLGLSDYDRVKFLLSAGREAEAFAIYDTAMQSEFNWDQGIEMILEADSAMAENYLRRFMELNGSDPRLQAALAQTLLEQDRTDEALELIDAALDSGEVASLGRLQYLMHRLPSEAIAERVDGWVDSLGGLSLSDSGSSMLSSAMQFYTEAGRPEEALDVQLMILDGIASGESAGGWLPQLSDELAQQYAGQIAPSVQAAEQQAGNDDELWGDLGDMYWKMGYSHDAQRCWEQANQIDPGDSEWTGNLHALANGQSPH